jgi:hypothetical protein
MAKNQVLTSVKLDVDMFEQFRVECVKQKTSLQKITERSIHMFLNDPEFRRIILNYNTGLN